MTTETTETTEPTESIETIETDAAGSAADTDDPPDRPPVRSRHRGAAFLLVLLTAVAAVAGAAWTGLEVQREREAAARERAALAAGRTAAEAFTSYDHRQIEDDLDRVTAMSTGDFRTEFTRALGALTGAIRQARGVSEGTVTQAGVTRQSDDSAVVIAAVDATITNRHTGESGQPSLRRYRLQITLDRVGDAWLISDIAPVS
jgi:Mce-associated membrane protein